MVKEQGLPYLVKQLLASGVRLNGKLQLCIHGGHTHTDLGWDERKQTSSLALNVSVQLWRKKIQMPRSWVNKKMVWRKVKYWHKSYPNHYWNKWTTLLKIKTQPETLLHQEANTNVNQYATKRKKILFIFLSESVPYLHQPIPGHHILVPTSGLQPGLSMALGDSWRNKVKLKNNTGFSAVDFPSYNSNLASKRCHWCGGSQPIGVMTPLVGSTTLS